VEARFRKASDVVASLFGRHPGGDEAAVLEVPEPAIPRDWPEKLRFRKRPKPYSRAISWTPVDSDERHSETRPYELFVAQGVLREVRQHLITATTGEPFGFLLGQVVYCPWRETPYIVIDSARRETQDLPPADEMDRFRHAWIGATRDARHRRGEVIGWYHRHGVLGLRLSEWDLRLQEEFFPEPWNCALVIAAARVGVIGGFIQRSRRARLFRKGLAPFQELVDLDAKLVNGLKPSCVDWQNYRAGESVSVIRAKWPASAARMRAWQADDHVTEATVPPGTGATPPKHSQRSPLGGRSWKAAARAASSAPPVDASDTSKAGANEATPLTPRQPLKKDEFDKVVARADDAVSYESEEHMGEPTSVPLPKKSRRRRPPTPRMPRTPGADDGEFLEAVWGEAPFEPEEEEPQVEKDEVEERAEAAAPPDSSPKRPRFELVPIFEPEPIEKDEPKSLEWLLSLLGDTLSTRGRTPGEAEEAAPAGESAGEAAPVWEEGVAGEDAGVVMGGVGAAGARARGATPRTPVTGPSPSTATPRRDRQAFVLRSSDPEDTEAPIPVVVFSDQARQWRPSRDQRRAAAFVAILVGGWLAYQSLRPPPAPEPPPPTPPSQQASAPPAEFIDLADAYLTRVQAFRQGLTDFRRGQRDCAGLAEDLGAVLGARADLASYVAERPELTERFETMSTELVAMRRRFAETGCEPPPDPTAEDIPQ